MIEKSNVFGKLSTKNKIKYPLAVLGSALAGLAFAGCGQEDKEWDIEVVCPNNTQLVLEDMRQPTDTTGDGLLSVTCEKSDGEYKRPLGAYALHGENNSSVIPENVVNAEKERLKVDTSTYVGLRESLSLDGNVPGLDIKSPAEKGKTSTELHLILPNLYRINTVNISD